MKEYFKDFKDKEKTKNGRPKKMQKVRRKLFGIRPQQKTKTIKFIKNLKPIRINLTKNGMSYLDIYK